MFTETLKWKNPKPRHKEIEKERNYTELIPCPSVRPCWLLFGTGQKLLWEVNNKQVPKHIRRHGWIMDWRSSVKERERERIIN